MWMVENDYIDIREYMQVFDLGAWTEDTYSCLQPTLTVFVYMFIYHSLSLVSKGRNWICARICENPPIAISNYPIVRVTDR